MSHGIRRTAPSAEADESRRAREATKLREYLDLQSEVLSKKKARDWTQAAFNSTTQLLRFNPELYTVWNYRRDIMTEGLIPQKNPEEIFELFSSELSLTFSALKQHPKVYWIWNHRRWCLEHTPAGPSVQVDGVETVTKGWKEKTWTRELAAVERMLDADARNFHAWTYRRYVVASSPNPRTDTEELAYTTRKIESNFSNFSAWHQRSKIFSRLWEQGKMIDPAVRDGEFEIVKHALYSDPNDQSAWLYHRWLIGKGENLGELEREIKVIEELLEIEPDSKWCLESLVHYEKLRSQRNSSGVETLNRQCLAYLDTLKRIDPQRLRRYEALGAVDFLLREPF